MRERIKNDVNGLLVVEFLHISSVPFAMQQTLIMNMGLFGIEYWIGL